jgi:hypothetical protein
LNLLLLLAFNYIDNYFISKAYTLMNAGNKLVMYGLAVKKSQR